MKLLLLDYFRRKAWILSGGALLELALGWFGGHIGGKTHDLWMFELQIGIFMGVFLLSLDLQRGIARAVTSLPLTSRQIGRAWWLVSVAFPSFAFSGFLWIGAASFRFFHAAAIVDTANLCLAGVFLLSLMGSTFTLVLARSQGPYATGWRRYLHRAFGAGFALMIGGGFLCINRAFENSIWLACALAVGLGLTIMGWSSAGRCVTNRASFRLAAQIVSRAASSLDGPIGLPTGYGGILRLITSTFVRSFLVGVAMMIIMPLVFLLQGGGAGSWGETFKFFPAMGMLPFWFVIIFSLGPALTQLRFLRSLPISATRLTAALIAILILPLVALQAVTAGIAGFTSGVPAALAALNDFVLTFPLVALAIILLAWLGSGMRTYCLIVLVMMLTQVVPVVLQVWLPHSEVPPDLCAAFGGGLLLLGFWLTRRSLLRSSRFYLLPTNAFGNVASGGGR